MKRHQVVDPQTGRVDLRYNPLSIEEDYYIPVRGQTNTEIVNLPGGDYSGQVDDVKYLRDKLFSALKIPQSYLTMGEGASEDATTLAQKDIRFARTIQRLQRVVVSEMEKIGIIHLFTLGYRNDDLLSFKLFLNNPSKIAELQELEHWDKKFSVAGNATEGYFSKRWVAEHLFGMSEDEFLRNQREMFFDKKFMAKLEAAAGGGEGGEDLGGEGGLAGGMDDLGGGLDDFGDEEGGDLGDLGGDEGDEAGGDDEDVLLAEPSAKRNDTDTPAYKRESYKMKKGAGSPARKKRHSQIHSPTKEYGNTTRSKTPGYGMAGMGASKTNPLAYGRVTEEKSFADLEEQKLFNTDYEAQRLIESLFNKKDKEHETQ